MNPKRLLDAISVMGFEVDLKLLKRGKFAEQK